MTDNKSKKINLSIISQYIKDLSFENPNAPKSLVDLKTSPEIKFHIDVKVNKLNDTNYDVELGINATALTKDEKKQTIFILELKYAGLFNIICEDEEIKKRILFIKCPELLFPFARSIVASTSTNSGFPPLMMSPMNFEQVFEAQQQNEKKKKAETETSS